VCLYSIEDGDHSWPRGRGPLGATAIIWAFFKAHARGQKPSKKSKKKGASK
jgi:poly(3-hydroxybutyrate) depolymerase